MLGKGAGRRCWAGGGSVRESGAVYPGTFVRAVGPAEAASSPSVAPAVAALGPGWSRRGHERQRRRRARGCQELRWRRGGGDKAERGGERGWAAL